MVGNHGRPVLAIQGRRRLHDELGTQVAKLNGEFEKRNTKVIRASASTTSTAQGLWRDIEETQHTKMNFPSGRRRCKVSKLYAMIIPRQRHADVRRVLSSIRPRAQAIDTLSGQHRAKLPEPILRVIDSLQN